MNTAKQTPQTRAAERAALNAATATWLAAGNTIEQVPASQYRKNHGLKRNGQTQLTIRSNRA